MALVRGIPLVVLLSCAFAFGQQRRAVLDPEAAGPDFAVQGEYTGEVLINEKMRGGAQIISLGDGKFKGTFYAGGLPGDGWEREKDVRHAESTIVDGGVAFVVEAYTVKLKNDALHVIETKTGANLGALKKVKRMSPTQGRKEAGAVVLFDGKVNGFDKGMVIPGHLPQGSTSKRKFGSFKLHLEFMLPFEPHGRGQGRGNSGVYLQGRYEVQILDSFGLEGKNNECGGIYGVAEPKVNMCFPPLTWQTYDIDFTAAEFDGAGKKTKNARVTVRHNGVLIQDNVELPHATTAAPNKEGPEPGPIYLQDHGHPVRFNNIWVVPK